MPKHGKRYRALYDQVDRERNYSPAEAVALVKGFQTTKFAETVEAHIRTGLNVRHADEQLRGTISLPNGLGKEQTIAVTLDDAGCDPSSISAKAGPATFKVSNKSSSGRIARRIHSAKRRAGRRFETSWVATTVATDGRAAPKIGIANSAR